MFDWFLVIINRWRRATAQYYHTVTQTQTQLKLKNYLLQQEIQNITSDKMNREQGDPVRQESRKNLKAYIRPDP